MALVPTKRIPQLPPVILPLTGDELLETVQGGVSSHVRARSWPLATDSLVTLTGMAGSLPGSRQLVSSASIAVVDGGDGGLLMLETTSPLPLPGVPTALVGLVPIPGAAITYMRSDGAPALDQSISPTWTGNHTFQGGVDFTGPPPTIAGVPIATTALFTDVTPGIVPASGGGSVNFLRADGVWQSPGGASPADPTVQIGLVAVNGVAPTFMRSDAASALDQSIAPTWTGSHTFNGPVNLAGLLAASGAEGISGQVLASQGPGLAPIWRTSSGGSIELGYNFTTSVAFTNPGSQKMGFDSIASFAAVSMLRFNILAFTNFDASTILSLLAAGNRIYIQQRNDASKAVVFQVATAATDQTGWWSVPVTHINSLGTPFPNNADLNCVFIMSGQGASGANPTALVGLTAINGAAVTFMRSDAAPALDQAISPTWTGTHVFTKTGGGNNAAIQLASAQPSVLWRDTAAALDEQKWQVDVSAKHFRAFTVNNADSAIGIWLDVNRGTGVTIDSIALTSTALTWNGNQLATTAIFTSVAAGLVPASGGGTANFLRADGVFATPGSTGVANPTAQVGLTAINGSAITAMRSDAAPAIDQAIAPTWTSPHTFTSIATALKGSIDLRSDQPGLSYYATNVAADSRFWLNYVSGNTLNHTIWNDAGSVADTWLTVTRVSAVITSVAFPAGYVYVGEGITASSYQFSVSRTTAGQGIGIVNTVAGTGYNLMFNASNNIDADFGIEISQVGAADKFARIGPSVGVPLRLRGSLVDVRAAGFYIQGLESLSNLGDGYLRLNGANHYANGVFTPGNFRGAGIIESDYLLRSPTLSNNAQTTLLTWGGIPYGTAYLTGDGGTGYIGLGINDGTLQMVLMSNGATGGIHITGDGKWLLYRSSGVLANCDYTLHASAFDSNSARALKRETGVIGSAAHILSRLRPILYKLLADGDDAKEQLGLIAEEVHEICPQLSDGKAVSYDRLALLLLADWQRANCH